MSPYPIASSALKKWGFELETSPKSRESLPAEPVNCKLLSTCFHKTFTQKFFFLADKEF